MQQAVKGFAAQPEVVQYTAKGFAALPMVVQRNHCSASSHEAGCERSNCVHAVAIDDDLPIIRPRLRRTAVDIDSPLDLYMNISSDCAS